MSDITIRNYNTDTDYQQIKQILAESGLFYEASETEDKLAEKVRRDADSLVVAVSEDEVVGTVSILEDGRMAFVFRLAVRGNKREQGIGSKLMEEAERRIKDRGHKEVWLLADETDQQLRDYYLKRKYEEGNPYRFMTKEIG